jgi:hypothetical protein
MSQEPNAKMTEGSRERRDRDTGLGQELPQWKIISPPTDRMNICSRPNPQGEKPACSL